MSTLNATPNKSREKIKSVLKFPPKPLRSVLFVCLLVVIVGAAVVFGGNDNSNKPALSDCGVYRTDRVIRIQGTAFKAEVAANSSEFQKGLSGRSCIKPDQAMLFAFTQPGQYPFWMKDMKFPLDFVWVNKDSQVVATRVNVQPSSYPRQFANSSDHPAKYVIELQANRVKQLGIVPGTVVNF